MKVRLVPQVSHSAVLSPATIRAGVGGGSVQFRNSGNSKHPPSHLASCQPRNRKQNFEKCFYFLLEYFGERVCVCHLSHFSWLWGRTKVDWWKLKPTPGYFLFIYIECKDGSEHNGTALWKLAIQLFNKAVKEPVTTSRVQCWTSGLNGFAIIWSSMAFILGAIMCHKGIVKL